MQPRCLTYLKNLNSGLFICLLLLILSCTTYIKKEEKKEPLGTDEYMAQCTPKAPFMRYETGDLPCTKNIIHINRNEKLKIYFKVTDKKSNDLYEYGYQELLRYKNNKIVEKMKLRKDEDAYWSEVPFVRIRKQKYLADLDNDGYLEFAIYPFSSGSAIWGTVRIFSLKEKIEFWGLGRYQFEGDTFVQLNCDSCSKFNPEACKECK